MKTPSFGPAPALLSQVQVFVPPGFRVLLNKLLVSLQTCFVLCFFGGFNIEYNGATKFIIVSFQSFKEITIKPYLTRFWAIFVYNNYVILILTSSSLYVGDFAMLEDESLRTFERPSGDDVRSQNVDTDYRQNQK